MRSRAFRLICMKNQTEPDSHETAMGFHKYTVLYGKIQEKPYFFFTTMLQSYGNHAERR
jgi:hypothetical protein